MCLGLYALAAIPAVRAAQTALSFDSADSVDSVASPVVCAGEGGGRDIFDYSDRSDCPDSDASGYPLTPYLPTSPVFCPKCAAITCMSVDSGPRRWWCSDRSCPNSLKATVL